MVWGATLDCWKWQRWHINVKPLGHLEVFSWRVEVCQGVHNAPPFSWELCPRLLGSQHSTARTRPHTNQKISETRKRVVPRICCIWLIQQNPYLFTILPTGQRQVSCASAAAWCAVLWCRTWLLGDACSARSFGEAGLLDGNGLVAAFLGWTAKRTAKTLQQSAVRAIAYGLLWNRVAWRSHAASRSPTWVRDHLWSVRTAVLRMTIPQCSFCSGRSPPKKSKICHWLGKSNCRGDCDMTMSTCNICLDRRCLAISSPIRNKILSHDKSFRSRGRRYKYTCVFPSCGVDSLMGFSPSPLGRNLSFLIRC